MKSILIESIEHKDQRYETVGDWYDKEIGIMGNSSVPTTIIRVSKMSDINYEILVAIHELVEKVLCDKSGITQQQVDEFDIQYNYDYKSSDIDKDMDLEPGNDPRAPYHRQHKIADIIERLMAIELGVDWEKYNNEVNSL